MRGHLRVRKPKGEVGKTTVAVGVTSALVQRGARVLVVDLDPQASATKLLGVGVEAGCTVADAMLEPERYGLRDAVIELAWGFGFVPAETALASRVPTARARTVGGRAG